MAWGISSLGWSSPLVATLDFDTCAGCNLVDDAVKYLFAQFVGDGVVVDRKPSFVYFDTALDATDLGRTSIVFSFGFCVGFHLYRSEVVFKPI